MKHNKPLTGITGFQLKYIAMATMLIDHIGYVFLPWHTTAYVLSRFVGRISFPIFCFLLAEGFEHTSNRMSYLSRLFLFALISEIPFDMAFFPCSDGFDWNVISSHQNVFFTLAAAFLTLCILEKCRFENQLFGYLSLLLLAWMSEALHFDYGAGGVFAVAVFYLCRIFRLDMYPLLVAILAVLPVFSPYPASGYGILLSIPLLLLYNGEKGSPLPVGRTFPGAKYLFYAFYPVHLLILSILKIK